MKHKTASILIVLAVVLAVNSGPSRAEPSQVQAAAPCKEAPPSKGSSRQLFKSMPLMVVANELESQGEAAFHLKYDAPGSLCLVETFSVGDATVTGAYNKFEKGVSTLLYRFDVVRSGEGSTILVLYSGTAGLLGGAGVVFHVSQDKGGVVSWYAMYKEEPAYPAVRELVENIISGKAEPLMAVRWPAGAKEGEILSFDSKRLAK